MRVTRILAIAICLAIWAPGTTASPFITVKGHRLYSSGRPYFFVGANYWYGSLLGLEKDKKRGVERLRHELDFLKANGITNLRLMAGAEGSGSMNGVTRVGPPLQPVRGRFDESVLDGLDLVLYEMGKRKMTAVVFLSNNWEWSGGFQQYLIWNKTISEEWLTKKPSWNELRDLVAKFYFCEPCKAGYNEQAELILNRRNRFSGKKYSDDPAIMAWELANEPRPMRPVAVNAYKRWIAASAVLIKRLDRHHLVTIGHEGRIGTEDIALYEAINADENIDYLTIHIWPKNWGWFVNAKMAEGYSQLEAETGAYIAEHAVVAKRLNKPLVIEEFGLPRDGQSFDIDAATSLREEYFAMILGSVGSHGSPNIIAGANFWAFGGSARPIKGQLFWKAGNDLMGDPPMEEQGLNSVFDSDVTTWRVIRSVSQKIRK